MMPIAALQQATRAYSGSTIGAVGGSPAASGGGFGGMVRNAAESALQTLRTSEHVTAMGMVGKADVLAVAQAATDAEVTVKSLSSVLSKALGAYNDVLKMSA